jgi:RNA polymerase sigma-70 factor (ECF subfamily)
VPEPSLAARVLDDAVERHILTDHDLSHLSFSLLALVGVSCVEALPAGEIGRRISAHADVTTGDAGERNSRCEDAGVTDQALERARAGEEDAFRELTEPYRRELQVHIYRIVGSSHDAEDLLQETLLAAWRGLDAFEGRASVRSWLYRIATNRSLDALRATRRRPEDPQRMTGMPEPTRHGEAIWLEPFPDVLLEGIPDQAPGPEARYETKEAIELGFIVGLQHLSPPQRAVLVLRDVLGYRAEEVAEMLDTTTHSVNSLLRRARAAFESRLPAAGRERAPLPDSKGERDSIGRFADAIQTGDVDGVVALLTDDAWLTMPPEPYEYQGPAAIGAFLGDRTIRRGAPLLVPTRANSQPAFGAYFRTHETEVARLYGMIVLTLEGPRISAITWFGGNSAFAHFGLPRILR